MGEKIIQFNDTEIEKYKFHQHKNTIHLYKIVISNKVPFGKQTF